MTQDMVERIEALEAAIKPVMIYDLSRDERRPVTQGDVDELVRIAQRYSGLRSTLRRWLEDNP